MNDILEGNYNAQNNQLKRDTETRIIIEAKERHGIIIEASTRLS